MRISLYTIIWLSLLSIIALFCGVHLAVLFPMTTWGKTLFWVAHLSLFFFPLMAPLRFRSGRVHPFWTSIKVQLFSYFLQGFWFLLFLLLLVLDFLEVPLELSFAVMELPFPFQPFVFWKTILALATSILLSIIGLIQAKQSPQVEEIKIPINNLPSVLEELRIVQISDVHIGPTIRRAHLQRMVKLIINLRPHLVVITGDFIDGPVEILKSELAPLSELRPLYGIYFVTGNHEFYWGAKAWLGELQRYNITVLQNEHRKIVHKGEAIVLAGVHDRTASLFSDLPGLDLQAALLGADPRALRILLVHQPKYCTTAVKAGIHLQLSGHTHAGQSFPWPLIVSMVQPFFRGLYQVQGMWLYVNRGAGYWGPPTRLGVSAEITLIQLIREGPESYEELKYKVRPLLSGPCGQVGKGPFAGVGGVKGPFKCYQEGLIS